MNELTGKVALITGAATGIGCAAARLFAEEGGRLVLVDRNREQGEALAASLRANGNEAIFVAADVAVAADCERMVEQAVSTYGRLDVAFNNAGIADVLPPPGTVDYPLEMWDRMIAVNLSGVFYCLKYEIAAMLRTAGAGAIVNTSSLAGQIAFPRIPAYIASKHGVVGLTRTVAVEYGARGIRCNAIGPGFIDTEMARPALIDPQFAAALPAAVPMARVAAPREVAEAALWLCSPRASYVTGAFLAVDGGFLSQ